MKKKLLLCLALLMLALPLGACGKKNKAPLYPIDYGASALFTEEDLEGAVKKIQAEFRSWDGCEMHSLRYAGDEMCNEESIAWLNKMAEARDKDLKFTRCACFFSNFHSPVDESKAGAWNTDYEYTDWQWWLGRTAEGEWTLMDWGY